MRKDRTYRKRPLVESEIGMDFNEYLRDASRRGLSQKQMAEELGVQQTTLGRWIEDLGFERVPVYRRRKVAA